MSARWRNALAMLVLVAVPVLASCSGRTPTAAGGGVHVHEPATVTDIGHGGLHRIALSAQGARRIGLQTAPVRAGASGAALEVPTAAVIYKEDGSTWVYLETAPLTFQRAAVTVARTMGTSTELSSGPPPGSVVVTVGVAELRGAEDGVPGEQ
ncbi:MAG TPA: hypothetical protein VKB75_17905 [Jatrophihabitans sp.]|nr:hypothetical protein [Jatrophihabitans sp.]